VILLSSNYVTTSTSTFAGTEKTVTTDVLRISYVELSFGSGSVTAFVQKGIVVNGVFTENMPKIRIDVQPDGSFRSNDGTWQGTLPNWNATLGAIASSLDGILLSAGLVQGTEV